MNLLFFCSNLYSNLPFTSGKTATDALRYSNDVLLLDQERVCLSLPASKKLTKRGGGGEMDGLNFSFPSLARGTRMADVLARAQMHRDSCSPP